MSARAGWYAVPAEPGTMRFWDGTAWTDHRQPLPPAEGSVPIAAPSPAAAAPARPATAVVPQPTLPAARVPAPVPPSPGFDGPTGPVAVVPPQLAGVAADLWTAASRYAASEQGRSTGEAVVGGAMVADGVVGFGRNREGIGGAVKMMLFGLVFLAVGLLVVKPLLIDAGTVGAGEAQTVGTVTARNESRDDDGDRLCSPDASYTVDGAVHTASAGYRSSSCPSVGATVDVIYDVARPADARIAPDATFRLLGWVFPLAGLLMLVGGLWTFVVRAGQIGVGGALLLRGLRGRRAAADAGTP